MSDTTAVNQAYFNKLAPDYDGRFQKAMAVMEKELRASIGFHHFDDCALAARRLAARLRPGGVLLVVDFVTHAADADLAAAAGVRHHGFSEPQVRALFEAAGAARGFALRLMADDIVFERPREQGGDAVRRVFVARGEKA